MKKRIGKLKNAVKTGYKAGAGNTRSGSKANKMLRNKKTKTSTKVAVLGAAVVGTASSKKGRSRFKKEAYRMTAKHRAAISRALKGKKRK